MSRKSLTSRLRDRVALEEPNLVDNGRGGRVAPAGQAKWRVLKPALPAEIIALRGGEALENLVQRSRQLYRVTIRRGPQIRMSMRLIWTDPVVGRVEGNIRSAALNDTRDGVVMTVEAGVATA